MGWAGPANLGTVAPRPAGHGLDLSDVDEVRPPTGRTCWRGEKPAGHGPNFATCRDDIESDRWQCGRGDKIAISM